MKNELRLETISKEYFSKLIASKMSVNDIMPLFTKANEIFELVKGRSQKKQKKK